MWLATKTLKRIDEALEVDQGNRYRYFLGQFLPKIEDAYRQNESPFRSHLGVSLIGRECSRELWYSFWWAVNKKVSAKALRIFNRGHLEEARFLAMLAAANFELWFETNDGGQFRLSQIGGHYGTALDGVVRGLPELPAKACAYTEFKTINEKGFVKLQKGGMRTEKYEHYVQMVICMEEMKLPYGLYLVANKNTDELHGEIIELDENALRTVDYHKNKASYVIFTKKEAPRKINPSPSWWKCRYCDKKETCHLGQIPEVNCRTCLHSIPNQDGSWSCQLGNPEIYTEAKYTGCSNHVFNPAILPDKIIYNGTQDGLNIDITLPNGDRFLQGPQYITSIELHKKGKIYG